MRSFLQAFQFLTIIPFFYPANAQAEDIGRSTSYFPIVGAVQGLILVGLAYIMSWFFVWEVASIILLAALLISNGGFHLDGLADSIDGIAGGANKKERLKIMKDPHIGVIGVVFVVVILLAKFIAIKNLSEPIRYQALFLMPVIGRWSMVPMAYWSEYAREENGLGKAFTDNTGIWQFIFATALAVIAAVALLGMNVLPIILLLLFLAYLWTILFKRKLGGITGDVLGFQSEVSEIFFLLAIMITAM